MADFTPGPWRYWRANKSRSYRIFAGGFPLANINSAGSRSATAPNANARLIAAAPELYEALLMAFGYLCQEIPAQQSAGWQHEMLEEIRTALVLVEKETT